jgi:hypothetical protein
MEHWKRTIERANRFFMQGELVDAREAYLQALALAQVLFERWANADEAVAAHLKARWPGPLMSNWAVWTVSRRPSPKRR